MYHESSVFKSKGIFVASTEFLKILQIVIAVLLVVFVLLQVRGQGGGLFGASEGSFRTRRGIERMMFQGTIFLVVAFLVISILNARYN